MIQYERKIVRKQNLTKEYNMKNSKKIILTLLITLFTSVLMQAKLSKEEKNLAQSWKMWKVEETGKEVEPAITRYLLDIKKNKTFSIVKNSEIAHRGTWEYARKTLVLHDKVTNKDIVLPVSELDHTHLVVTGAESPTRKTFMTPIVHKDAVHLTHREHLLVKKWTIYESTDEERKGAIYDFHEDKTFDYILNGHTVPVSTGSWELAADGKTITLKIKKTENIILDVLEFERHILVLKSRTSGVTNKMHDAYLTEKDGIELKTGDLKDKVEDTIQK
jgi:hypothetical protein